MGHTPFFPPKPSEIHEGYFANESGDLLSKSTSIDPLLKDLRYSKRVFYTLKEIAAKWKCPVDGLLDLAYQEQLVLSVMSANWTVESAPEDPASGEAPTLHRRSCPLDIPKETIVSIIGEGKAQVDHVGIFGSWSYRVCAGKNLARPEVTVEKLIVTKDRVTDYLTARRKMLVEAENPEPTDWSHLPTNRYRPRTPIELAAIFKFEGDNKEMSSNRWRDFSHHANRNALTKARISKAVGKRLSTYDPALVADWLVEHKSWLREEVNVMLHPLIGEKTTPSK